MRCAAVQRQHRRRRLSSASQSLASGQSVQAPGLSSMMAWRSVKAACSNAQAPADARRRERRRSRGAGERERERGGSSVRSCGPRTGQRSIEARALVVGGQSAAMQRGERERGAAWAHAHGWAMPLCCSGHGERRGPKRGCRPLSSSWLPRQCRHRHSLAGRGGQAQLSCPAAATNSLSGGASLHADASPREGRPASAAASVPCLLSVALRGVCKPLSHVPGRSASAVLR